MRAPGGPDSGAEPASSPLWHVDPNDDFDLDDIIGSSVHAAGSRAKDVRWATELRDLIDKVAQYVARGPEDFFDEHDDRTFEAVQMRIVNMGHAIGSMTPEFRESIAPDLSRLYGMRSRLAHDYLAVPRQIVWDTATVSLPRLRDRLTEVLDAESP